MDPNKPSEIWFWFCMGLMGCVALVFMYLLISLVIERA